MGNKSMKDYETETLLRARTEAEYQQAVRRRSAKIISGIAVGAVLLSAFFLIIIGRDITRSNRYRRELEEARRRAEDLLAVREKLMLAITHDFKAPLGSIMGYADLLSRLTVDERQRFYLDNMKTSSEHLLKLVVDLLDFHRLDLNKAEINRVTFHPSRLLEEIHVSFEPLTAAKGLALHCDIAPELGGTYICDPLRLRQIINNLLSNAVKFTDQVSFPVILSAPVRVSHKHGDDQYNGYYSHRHHHFLGLLLFLLAVHCFLFTFSHGVFYSLKFNDEQSKKKFGKNANEREKIYSPLPANSIR